MRILVITAFYPPHHLGGFEMRCENVVDGLRNKHEIRVMTTQCADSLCNFHLDENGVYRVLHQRLETTSVLKQIIDDCSDLKILSRQIKEFHPDIIYIWAIQNLSLAIFPYLLGLGVHAVYDEGGAGLIYLAKIQQRGIYFYTNEYDPFAKKILKSGIYLLARIISLNKIKPTWTWPVDMCVSFNSRSALKYSLSNGVLLKNARVIYPGLETSKFPYCERNYIGNHVSIIMPGRIKPEKGTKDGIYLVEELQKRNFKVSLKIVGYVQSEEYLQELFEIIAMRGLEDEIEITPAVPQSELARFYRASDVCFFSSYFKTGLSRVPLEAMASGCLVVSYGNEGSSEIIVNRKNGFIVSEGDVETIANLIENLYQHPDQYQKTIQVARQIVEDRFSMKQYLERVDAFLLDSFEGNLLE